MHFVINEIFIIYAENAASTSYDTVSVYVMECIVTAISNTKVIYIDDIVSTSEVNKSY